MIPESTSRRALVLQHSPEAGPGTLQIRLHRRGYAVERWLLAREATPPSPLESYDAAVSSERLPLARGLVRGAGLGGDPRGVGDDQDARPAP